MMKKILILVWIAVVFAGCGKQIPDDIIQPDTMEALLYDYHLAVSLKSDLPYAEKFKEQAYMKYVFKKHDVSEEEFDQSLAWYSRHSNFLSDIYKAIDSRLESEEESLRDQIRMREGQITVSMSGDSVDVWQERKLIWLRNSEYLNKITFSLKADTSFKHHDALELKADFLFLPNNKASKAVLGLNFVFKNDSVQGLTKTIEMSGNQSFYLKADSAFDFRNVNGYIYYPSDNKKESSVIVSNISLMRYHNR